MEEEEAGKARLPTVEFDRRHDETIGGGWRRPGTSATRVSGPRYHGALP